MTHVLLTGATGLVGAEVASRLVDRAITVTAVTHRTRDIVVGGGEVPDVGMAAGDVSRPGFGLSPDDASRLSQSVTCIVHSAATTDFGLASDTYEQLNVGGTRNAIELARSWQVPLVYISTAYVCGMRRGRVAETDLDHDESFGTEYEHSKFRAEQLIRTAVNDGLRAYVVRPGIVTGRSCDGAIRDYKNLYPVVKLIVEGKLRSLPGRYDATLALAPIDHVADVITAATVAIHDDPDPRCRTFHAVGAQRLSLRDISDVFAEFPSFAVARFVPSATFSAADLAADERMYFDRVGSLYTSYFNRHIEFETSATTELLGRSAPATGPEYLRTLLDYCLDSGYLGQPLPSVAEVLASHGVRGGSHD